MHNILHERNICQCGLQRRKVSLMVTYDDLGRSPKVFIGDGDSIGE